MERECTVTHSKLALNIRGIGSLAANRKSRQSRNHILGVWRSESELDCQGGFSVAALASKWLPLGVDQ